VLARGGWRDCPDVQKAFDHWRPVYNTQRPHEALGLQTPVSRYRVSQRSYPETLSPVQYAEGVQVRRVDENGWFSYQGHDCKAGRAFCGQDVGIRPTETDGIIEVIFLTQVIKEWDLRQQKPALL
jgi:hypothetical protein